MGEDAAGASGGFAARAGVAHDEQAGDLELQPAMGKIDDHRGHEQEPCGDGDRPGHEITAEADLPRQRMRDDATDRRLGVDAAQRDDPRVRNEISVRGLPHEVVGVAVDAVGETISNAGNKINKG